MSNDSEYVLSYILMSPNHGHLISTLLYSSLIPRLSPVTMTKSNEGESLISFFT